MFVYFLTYNRVSFEELQKLLDTASKQGFRKAW